MANATVALFLVLVLLVGGRFSSDILIEKEQQMVWADPPGNYVSVFFTDGFRVGCI